jgi:hypothetical protein
VSVLEHPITPPSLLGLMSVSVDRTATAAQPFRFPSVSSPVPRSSAPFGPHLTSPVPTSSYRTTSTPCPATEAPPSRQTLFSTPPLLVVSGENPAAPLPGSTAVASPWSPRRARYTLSTDEPRPAVPPRHRARAPHQLGHCAAGPRQHCRSSG